MNGIVSVLGVFQDTAICTTATGAYNHSLEPLGGADSECMI